MPIRIDSSGRWHAEVCVDRKRIHRVLPKGASAGDAKRLEAELPRAAGAARPTPVPRVPGDPALVDVLADYTERHAQTLRSPDTARHHALRIGRWIEGRRASETRAMVAAIVADMTGHYAPATINRSLGALKKALSDAWQRGDTQHGYSTPVRRLPENNQRTVYLDMAQVKAIADHASDAVRTAIWVSLPTGCRRGEVCKIEPAHVRADAITIPAGNTKTLRYRQVPITPALRPWLARLPLPIGYGRASRAAFSAPERPLACRMCTSTTCATRAPRSCFPWALTCT